MMTQLMLHNSRTRKVEAFIPREDGQVTMYTCGPTVYSYQHLGNLRSYWFGSLLNRTLRWHGYEVQQVINVTDVGHLVGDGWNSPRNPDTVYAAFADSCR